MFQRGSRYYGLSHRTHEDEKGNSYRFVERRLIPRHTERTSGTLRVEQAERLDLVAARALGDPSRFWQLCDANAVLDPFVLNAASGRLLDVPE